MYNIKNLWCFSLGLNAIVLISPILVTRQFEEEPELDDVLSRRRRDARQWRVARRQGANYLSNFIGAMYSAHVIAKYSGVQVTSNYALDDDATRFCRKVSRARSPRWPRRIPLGSTDLPPVSLSFLDRLNRQAVVKRDRNSDKSSANCIYAVQKRTGISTTITDLSSCDGGRIPLGRDWRETNED